MELCSNLSSKALWLTLATATLFSLLTSLESTAIDLPLRHDQTCKLAKEHIEFTKGNCTARIRVTTCAGLCKSQTLHTTDNPLTTGMLVPVAICNCCTVTKIERYRSKLLRYQCSNSTQNFSERVFLSVPLECGCVRCGANVL